MRAAAPEFAFVEYDTLALADAANPLVTCRDALAGLLAGAAGIVAHGSAARPALEAVAAVDPDLPIVLLSPLLVTRMTAWLRVFRAVIGSPPGRSLLQRYGASKQQRLAGDVAYVRKQLLLLGGEAAASDALVAEAQTRLADPRTERVAARSAELLLAITQPISAQLNAAVTHRTVLVGEGVLDRKTPRRMTATVVAGSTGALMLDRPDVVAAALRTLLAQADQAARIET